MPTVLVLVATCNGRQWIVEQINSILTQEGVNVRVEIGDDESLDGTRQLISSRWANDNQIQVRGWEQGSGSAGANFRRLYRSVDVSDADFVALADQDDIWHPQKLAEAIKALQQSGAAGYSCAVQSFWPDGRRRLLGQVPRLTAADFLFEGAGQGCTFVVRRSLFVKVQQFCREHHDATEALHYHDWLIYLLARSWGMTWYFDPQPWMQYRQHGQNEIGSKGGVRSAIKRITMIRTGWYKREIFAALEIFRCTGREDRRIIRFSKTFLKSDSVRRRVALSLFFAFYGRRRLTERFVMTASALVGWI